MVSYLYYIFYVSIKVSVFSFCKIKCRLRDIIFFQFTDIAVCHFTHHQTTAWPNFPIYCIIILYSTSIYKYMPEIYI